MFEDLNRRHFLAGLGALSLTAARPAWAASAEEILAATDRMRNPQQSFRSAITITEYIGGRKNDQMQITVYSKPRRSDGQFRSIVHIDAPKKDAGKVMLRDGKDLYFYDPDAANTIRISPQQRLLGQASNGDVMTTNFARDYTSKLVGQENIEGARKVAYNCYSLQLRARGGSAFYKSIDYWVDTKTMRPVKGRFYSSSGKLLKIAFYDDFRSAMGATRPMKVSIVDGLNSSRVSVMAFGRFAPIEIPDSWFQKSYLPRFQKP
ncbi:outer membrane lipoprotein-sorting protein [Paracoccus sp. (in: a-proteobacteria)]|uniref:outer membrane lipoprotein-sorting protein n=1 Tax=Paracoccus sp. TaxID=267 RepID=UPI003A8C1216